MQTSPNPDPLISVVIPTYNRAHVVGRAIKSVLAQTLPDFECIVVDDASTDETVPLVEGFRDPRIRLVRLAENGGVSRARNAGIQAARGEWVAFLDSDDEWLPRKLELQLARLREGGDRRTGVVYCGCYLHDEVIHRASQTGVFHEGDVFDHLLRGWHPPTPSIFMVNRAALARYGGFDKELPCAQDYDLWLRLAEGRNHFAAVHQALAIKHEHAGGQMSADPAVRVLGSEILDRRWGPTIERRLGSAAYWQWRARRWGNVQSAYFKRIKHAVAHGERMMAWGDWLAMCRLLPRSRRNVIQALAVVVLGRGAYGTLGRAVEAFRRRLGGSSPVRQGGLPLKPAALRPLDEHASPERDEAGGQS